MSSDIIVKNVKKYFKAVKAVDDVSLNITEGKFVALLGPNGAGKTTLVEMIEGIQHPDSGEISIKGKTWKHNAKELRHILGISFQETKFFDKITVKETFELFASFYKLNKERIEEILELIDLKDKKNAYVVNLSGGQRQKLAVGLALLNKPQILLLDEPNTGLDPSARREIWNILKNIKKTHKTSLILTTHYMEEAEYLCDHIIIMDKGKILSEGSLDELLSKSNHTEMIEFFYEPAQEDIGLKTEAGKFNIDWDRQNNKANLSFKDGKITEHIPEFLDFINKNSIKLKSFSIRKTTLEDLFISMTGRHFNE